MPLNLNLTQILERLEKQLSGQMDKGRTAIWGQSVPPEIWKSIYEDGEVITLLHEGVPYCTLMVDGYGQARTKFLEGRRPYIKPSLIHIDKEIWYNDALENDKLTELGSLVHDTYCVRSQVDEFLRRENFQKLPQDMGRNFPGNELFILILESDIKGRLFVKDG